MKYCIFLVLFFFHIPVSAMAKAGMPQLEISSYSSQIFWLIFSFVFLYFLMAKIALPKIGEILTHRRDKITSDLDKAESLNKEASLAIESFQTEIEKTKIQATNMIRESNIEISSKTASEIEKIKKTINIETEKSEEKINYEKNKLLESINDHCIPIVKDIVKRVSGRDTNTKDVVQALESLAKSKEA